MGLLKPTTSSKQNACTPHEHVGMTGRPFIYNDAALSPKMMSEGHCRNDIPVLLISIVKS